MNVCLLCTLLAACLILYYLYNSCNTKESYTRNHVYVDPGYKLESPLTKTDFDQQQSGLEFAHMVSGSDVHFTEPATESAGKRYAKLHDSNLMPKLAKSVTQYDVDIADPKNYFFSAQAPRVVLKDRLYQQADITRGDIPIRMSPGSCVVKGSSHGRESARHSALFDPTYDTMINAYVASADYPQYVANQGTVMDQ